MGDEVVGHVVSWAGGSSSNLVVGPKPRQDTLGRDTAKR
jgi:hypothetical protein